ncbi:MAG: PAS domain S-box protein, partial [Dehalococcoidia bacterium]|nr:PAS domain S-box protein [Dehalococcoidia bacterium]
AETAVMYLLPHLLTDPHGFAAIFTDSSILATLSVPPLWWLLAARARAEKALRRSEQQFRSLIENALDIIMGIGPDGALRYVSPSVQRTLGYEPEELVGKNPSDLVHPDDLPAVMAAVAENLRSLEPGPLLEARLRHRDGSWRVVEAIGRGFLDDSGAVGIVVSARDITGRKRAEEALRESEERTRQIVETAYDALISMDARGVITAWNGAAETIFGWPRQEALGRTLAETIIPPQLREAHMGGLQRFLATGEGPVLNQRIEITALHHDGHEFPVELAVWAIRSGETFTFNAFVHDITERKQAEEAQRRLNQELEKEQKQIEALNRSLERKVKERTRELRLANRELQQRNRQLLTARAQAVTDALTGLHNHRAFQERVRDEFSRAHVNGTEIGLIMMDIDGFKSVNDSLGHLAGDRILRRLARTLARAVPQDDAYRYGGDEFAVLLPGASCGETMALAEQLRRSAERHVNGSGEKVTVSLGVACYPDTASSAEELIYGSDAAMYWAKSAGKNCVGDWSNLVRHRAEGVLPWYAADRAIRAPDTVSALVAALAAKDPATASHTERCSWYAARLAEELGLGERDTSIVRLSSLLHDIGKLAVPDYVLFKPGPLDDHEWTLMRQHPVTALHILGQIRSVADATPAILHHHEHFDGSGYPDGLAGDRIPIASRILLVSDAFDAMTTDRPYRKAMPVEAALEELKSNAGTQFDPEVVEAFLRILEQHGAKPLTWKASVRPGLEPVGAAGHAHGDGR